MDSKISLKLQNLAVVNAWTKKINNWNYFKYYKIDFYTFKDFDCFLDLIERGIIKLNIKVDIHTDKNNYGKTYDHGCGFAIKEKDIIKLFDEIQIKSYHC